MTTEALEKAIRVMGGQSNMARDLATRTGRPIRQGHIWAWLNRTKRVPPELAPYIEAGTAERGEEVSRRDLCPDFPWGPTASGVELHAGAVTKMS